MDFLEELISYSCAVTKIYTQIFSFFRKRVANVPISKMRPVERSGNFAVYRGIPVGMIKECWFAFNIEWVGHSFRYILRKYRTLRNRLFKMLTDISPVGLSTDQAAPNSAQESYYVNSALDSLGCIKHLKMSCLLYLLTVHILHCVVLTFKVIQ